MENHMLGRCEVIAMFLRNLYGQEGKNGEESGKI